MSLSLKEQYKQDLLAPDFVADTMQEHAIDYLDNLQQQLIAFTEKQTSWRKRLSKRKMILGLYMWGGLGTGKSYLMNTFFHSLPFEQKIRLHFHEFMHKVYEQLKEVQGKKDPLKLIAKQWASQAYVICFDEFFVKDIGDAMLLGNLLTALFEQGVCLVATSNVEPSNLYKNGLQRSRFLPAIKALIQHVTVLKVDSDIDYRVQHVKLADVFFSPADEYAQQMMMQSFHYYAREDMASQEPILVNKRRLETIRHDPGAIWFDFSQLCETARSSDDYLQIAQQYPIILLSNVPQMGDRQNNALVRFLNLIDILYDQHVMLVMSLAESIDQLYQGEGRALEFKRTISRLQEMQSQQYLDECELQ